jgi:hypothetical protein
VVVPIMPPATTCGVGPVLRYLDEFSYRFDRR